MKIEDIELHVGGADFPYKPVRELKAKCEASHAFAPAPTENDINAKLRAMAAKVGANAVINVEYNSGVSFTSWKSMTGTGLAVVRESDSAACPHCAEIIKRAALKCRFCGEAVEWPSSPPSVTSIDSSQSSDGAVNQTPLVETNNSIWWIAAVSVVVLITVIIAAAGAGGNTSSHTNTLSIDENLVTADMNAVDMNAVDMNATALKATDEDEVAATEVSTAEAASAPSTTSVPYFDTTAYCQKIGETAGGSYEIEETCRDQEREALSKLNARAIPARIIRYCSEIGDTAGGSYEIMETCVEQEADSASRL